MLNTETTCMQTTTKNVKRACPHTPGVRLRVLPTSGLLLLSLLLLLPTAAWGQFEFVTNNGAITITAYTGPGGQVAIPGSINDLPVTTIGDYAFAGADIITGVTIPNSVTSIGEGSFSDCIYLTCVTIPNSVISIGYGAFYDCLSLATVTNGAGVATVGGLAFAWDFSLTGVYFLGNAPSLGGRPRFLRRV